jgi:hypothetical protein
MQSREELQKRIADLEQQLSVFSGGRAGWPVGRGVRKRAAWGIWGLPFYDIAFGPDPGRGESRGHAKGIFAVGDIATGVVAVGGLARGAIAVGGLAVGVIGLGGLCVAAVLAIGGLALGPAALGGGAIGGVAIGGGAVGGVAIGGGAYGYYACGGGAGGRHVVAPGHRDPEAVEFLRDHGLSQICGSR